MVKRADFNISSSVSGKLFMMVFNLMLNEILNTLDYFLGINPWTQSGWWPCCTDEKNFHVHEHCWDFQGDEEA